MQAIILAGGRGTRLRPYTTVVPKPLLPIGEMPILEVIIRQLRRAGFDDLVLCSGYLAELIRAFVGDGKRFGGPIRFVMEDQPLGTAGALALVENLEDDFLVINGDTLTTLDFAALMQFHKSSGAAATIATHEREEMVDFGVVETDGNGRLARYIEKPVHRYQVSMGVNVLSRAALRVITPGKARDMPDLMQRLVSDGDGVACYPTRCIWLDIGRPADYEKAIAVFAEHQADFLGDKSSWTC